ncbi:nad kinase, partial [Perkinsus olseni]
RVEGGKETSPNRSGRMQGWRRGTPALTRTLTPKSVIDFCRDAAQEANLPGISSDGIISPELKPALQEWLDKAKVVSSLQKRTGFNYETLYRLATIFHSLARGKKHLDPIDFENGYALVNVFLNYDQYGEKHSNIPLARVTYMSAFQAFDIDRSGTIDIEEFILGIAWLARSQSNLNSP